MMETLFGVMLQLWKACEAHGFSTAQMYHISERIHASADPESEIFGYLSAVEDGDLLPMGAVPRRMTVVSEGACFGDPDPEAALLQRVTVTAEGKVTITLKNHEKELLRKEQLRLWPKYAAAWLEDVNTHLSVRYGERFSAEAGTWRLEATYADGKKSRLCGFLVNAEDRWLRRYSEQLREALDRPELYVFSRDVQPPSEPEKQLLCHCEFRPGGKQYSYRTTDESVCVGDTLLVPVGSYGAEKRVRVVGVEDLETADLPPDGYEIKEAIRKLTPEEAAAVPVRKRPGEVTTAPTVDFHGKPGAYYINGELHMDCPVAGKIIPEWLCWELSNLEWSAIPERDRPNTGISEAAADALCARCRFKWD